jgi:hypothetical protein
MREETVAGGILARQDARIEHRGLRVFRDAQRERGGVIGGERVRDSRNPAWRCLAGFAVHGVGWVLILLI